MFTRITVRSLYSIEIEIGSLFLKKIRKMVLGLVLNASNKKDVMINNFAFIPTQDFFTLKIWNIFSVSIKSLIKTLQEALPIFCICPEKRLKCILQTFRVKKIFGRYESKVVYHKKLVSRSGVRFFIQCILDYGSCHLVDSWKKRPPISIWVD